MSAVHAQHRDCVLCHECGHLQSAPAGSISPGEVADSRSIDLRCDNCATAIHVNRPRWLDHATAFTLTAAVLFVVTITFPFLGLRSAGFYQEASIVSGILALVDRSQWLLAALVFVTIIVMPLVEIAALLYLLIPYRMQRQLPKQRGVFRWLVVLQPWSMLEIFAVAVLVTLVKLGNDVSLVPGVGMYAFFLLVACLLGAYLTVNRRHIWSWLWFNNYFVQTSEEPVVACTVCEALVGRSIVHSRNRCPRCRSVIHELIPHSFQKTAALVLAAAILYIPANILPMMSYSSFGTTRTDTIFSGVVVLASEGLWWVAVVVFVASVLVPIAKLVVLTYFLWLVKSDATRNARQQRSLYRSLELVGRWSMVDVYVVTLLVALVQFGLLGQVEPRGAIVAFGGVVVLTMLATQTFDVRLLGDAEAHTEKAHAERAHAGTSARASSSADPAKRNSHIQS